LVCYARLYTGYSGLSYPLTSFHRAHCILPGCLVCQLFCLSERMESRAALGIFVGLVRLTKRSQKPKMVMTKITSSPSVRYEERYRLWMAPLLAAISESLTPTYPFKEVGLGRSPYQRTGQAVMFAAAPTSQHFVALINCPQRGRLLAQASPTPFEVTFDVRPPILRWGPRVRLSSYLG
jgi:hypothetical protein